MTPSQFIAEMPPREAILYSVALLFVLAAIVQFWRVRRHRRESAWYNPHRCSFLHAPTERLHGFVFRDAKEREGERLKGDGGE